TPPDQEGVDTAPPAPSGAPGNPAAPNVAPAPGGAPATGGGIAQPVGPYCPFDLRGAWMNYGRGMSGPIGPYSANVNVRQYHSWTQAQQDDGTSYYGQCTANRLQFDVYMGNQFIGRESGMIVGPGLVRPLALPGGPLGPAGTAQPDASAPAIAPAPPVP